MCNPFDSSSKKNSKNSSSKNSSLSQNENKSLNKLFCDQIPGFAECCFNLYYKLLQNIHVGKRFLNGARFTRNKIHHFLPH